jgi:hypothetical protein
MYIYPATYVMLLNIFVKKIAKNLAIFAQITAIYVDGKMLITLVVKKNANFFADNWQKMPKIVITTFSPLLQQLAQKRQESGGRRKRKNWNPVSLGHFHSEYVTLHEAYQVMKQLDFILIRASQ